MCLYERVHFFITFALNCKEITKNKIQRDFNKYFYNVYICLISLFNSLYSFF